jgi:hypothetical protein
MARIYAGSQGLDLLRAILNCAPYREPPCCERFSLIVASDSQERRSVQAPAAVPRSAADKAAVASKGTACDSAAWSGCNGARESKGGNVEEAHGRIDKKD